MLTLGIAQAWLSARLLAKVASVEGLFALEFSNHFVHNVEVTHQVEAGMLVVQALVGARGVEDVKRTLATHVEPLGLSRPLLSKLC